MLLGIHGYHCLGSHKSQLFAKLAVLNLLHLWAFLDVIQTAPVKNFRHTLLVDGGLARQQAVPSDSMAKLPCKENEYYDGVVQKCSVCSDICFALMTDRNFCSNNCPDYFRNNFMQQNFSPQVLSTVFHYGHIVISSPALVIPSPDGTTPNFSDGIERFIDQPLFWTSIISLCISICSTIVIIILCVRRANLIIEMRRRRRYGPVHSRPGVSPHGQYAQEDAKSLENSKKINDSEEDAGGMYNENLKFNQLSHKSQEDGSPSRKLNILSISNQLESGKRISPLPLQADEQDSGSSMPSHHVIKVVEYVRSSLVDKTPAHGSDHQRSENQMSSFLSNLRVQEHSSVYEDLVSLISDPVSGNRNKSNLSCKNQLTLNTAQSQSRVSFSSIPPKTDLTFKIHTLTNMPTITVNPLADDYSSPNNKINDWDYNDVIPVGIYPVPSSEQSKDFYFEKLSSPQDSSAVRPSTELSLTSALVTSWPSLT